MTFTPIYVGRAKSVRDTLSGQFVKAGPHKTADVLVGKRLMTDAEVKHRKKLQAGIAVTTSTLGLGALGLKGGSVAAGRVARTAGKVAAKEHLPPLQRLAAGEKEARFHKLSHNLNNAALNTGIVSSGIGGVGGYNFASYTRAEGKKRQVTKSFGGGMDFGLDGVQQGEEISKKDWMNISEHERRARDSRRHQRGARDVAGLGATVGAGAIAHGVYTGRDPFAQAATVGSKAKQTAKANWNLRGVKGPAGAQLRGGNLKALGGTMKANPHGTAALAGYGAAGLGLAAMGASRANESRHNRAIARQRRQRAVAKAYDPERNRQRRLNGYQQATMFGAGATAVGAGHFARQAAPGLKKFASTKYGKGSLKSLGAAGALGVGAAGLAVGSQRINSYKKGRGRSYSPLRTIGY